MKLLHRFLVSMVLAMSAFFPAHAQGKPNIVVIMVDDLDVAVYKAGQQAGFYPNLNQLLVSQGTSFNNNFVTLSICCPSRATYLTGQYAHNHGTIRNVPPAGGFQSFNDSSTLPIWLKSAGYTTAHMGKYLNGYARTDTYVPPGWDYWAGLLVLKMFDWQMTINGAPAISFGSAPEDYQTDVLANYADAYIRQQGTQPFFLSLTPSAPHLEGEGENGEDDGGKGIRAAPRYDGSIWVNPAPVDTLPSFNEADMSDKPKWMRDAPLVDPVVMVDTFNQKVLAMRAVDDLVGKLIKALKDTGKWDNTLFIFVSDNGYQYGTHRKSLTKVDFYEESIRVPLIVKAPNQTKAKVTDAFALNNDLAPTILDYAGATPVGGFVIDGRTLQPVVKGTGAGRSSFMVELPPTGQKSYRTPYYAVRTRDPLITQDATGQKVLVYAESQNSMSGVVTDIEFYDLTTDPYQIGSLHTSTDPVRVQQMTALKTKLNSLKGCIGKACKDAEQ